MAKKQIKRMLVGVDEVGRGPLAGPVAVGIVCFPENLKHLVFKVFGEVKDSKKLSEKGREVWLQKIKKLKKEGVLEYVVVYKSAKYIDAKGISKAIRSCIEKGLQKLQISPLKSEIRLDGSLRAPSEYRHQKTIIKGDEKELVIALASIVAKVSRDKRMVRESVKYTSYGFQKHKGYGTAEHRAALKKYGPSVIHRRSFCTSFLAK
jgi:ribonuclease HII